jgi:hypothetical protein
MKCRHARKMISQYVDHELTPDDAIVLMTGFAQAYEKASKARQDESIFGCGL